jgi:intracellular multiplication protein IcmG
MSDLNHHDDEEEYHFDDSESFDFGEHDVAAEEEFVGDEEAIENTDTKEWANERSVSSSNKKPLPTKKIIMVAGVVVLLIVGYLIMPNKKTSAVTAIPTATAPKEIVNAQNATIAEQNAATSSDANTALDNTANGDWLSGDTTAPTSNNTQAATAAPEEVTQTTQTTTQTTQSNAPDETNLPMQVQTLNQENQTLTLKLQQVTAQSEATAARAKSLEKVVAQLQAQVKQMTQTAPPPLKSAMPRSSAENNESKTRLVYYVQAIIPGRAWIADSNGRIITVTQGDRVEALNSTVKNIDPINGIVTLSNGRQIEYGMVAQ